MAILFVLLCLFGWTIFLSFVWGEIQYKHDIVFFGTGIVLIVLSLVSGKKLRVIKKASFDDTLITWPNQLLCPLKETV